MSKYIRIVRAFSESVLSEFSFSSLRSYSAQQDHFYLKWKPFQENEVCVLLLYSVEAQEIVRAIDEAIAEAIVQKMRLDGINISTVAQLYQLLCLEKKKASLEISERWAGSPKRTELKKSSRLQPHDLIPEGSNIAKSVQHLLTTTSTATLLSESTPTFQIMDYSPFSSERHSEITLKTKTQLKRNDKS